jgi:hypothetical protein
MTCQENGKWLLPPPPCVGMYEIYLIVLYV